ncbi:ribonuclease R [Caldisalinibacter kiritimatiensis]|uniref:Ribonuclease R n=1 Tax=Caldisalinibacter kiritimatiensis TaxID=1304284 RepID=R1CVT7_9FIRM|nr:ribonuclease R [Caldisalinibacter kiritimatiensis]EOD00754.1 3'-to-5' exoribonuclease RNase R [Caldisalinibacter kiritimatiensis]
MNTKEKIVEVMREQAYKPMLREELADFFQINRDEVKEFYKILDEMEAEGRIIKTRNNRYGIPERMNLVVGKLQGNPKGYGFVIPDNEDLKDIFVSPSDLNGALHGDKVVVRVSRTYEDLRKPEGEVIRILERANKKIVGTFEKSRNFGFVVPDDNRINMDVFIPKSEINGAKTDQKVVVEITKWPEKRRSPEGKVVEILGDKDDVGTDILAVIKKYGLSQEFPTKVINEAKSIPDTIPVSEIKRRRDLRDMTIFTIDGADAKDLDDAVSIEKLNNGNYKLGVHIADVSYYVKEGSKLDKEALKRGTSVYLVDRVIPMLPQKLSNGVCSLNPKVPRLTLSVFMETNEDGKVLSHEIVESIIQSKERLTYTDVSDILEKDDPQLKQRYEHILEELKLMEELCNILQEKREKRGSIDFNFDEAKIVLDKDGKPVDIRKRERRIANRMIEEFMLVCNETVAEYMYWTNTPFIYRIHEDPDVERINEFNKFIHNFGYVLKGTQDIHPKELQQLLKKVESTKEETVINTLMLRSLKKARYSSDSQSHFGLAARYYCHFTSPIRRYPDLQIHRIIKELLNGKITESRIEKLKRRAPSVAEQSSVRERIAEEAERETEDLKKVEYMSERIGEIYEGIISGITSFGIFVELDNTIEGLVHVSTLVDDYYQYDELNYCLIGERTKKTYKIGDVVKVQLVKADISSREIDFILIEE